MNIKLFPSFDITMLPWLFLYIYYIACVLVFLYGKFLEVELLVERIYAFKIVMNIAKLFPLEKKVYQYTFSTTMEENMTHFRKAVHKRWKRRQSTKTRL